MADGSLHDYWLVPETGGYAVTPATPVFVNVPLSKFSGGADMGTIEDDTIRADGQVANVRGGAITSKFTTENKFRYGSYDPIIEKVHGGTWTSNVLHQGVAYGSFTGERHFADISDKPYFRQPGVYFTKMGIKVGANSLIDCTFEGMSQDETSNPAIISGATYGSVLTATDPFDSYTGSISIAGTPDTHISDFSIDIGREIELKPAVGSRLTNQPGKLMFKVSGTITPYFENATYFDRLKANTFFALLINLTDPQGNALAISVPHALLNGPANRDVTGPGVIKTPLKWMAAIDTVTGNTIQITRTPHA